MCSSFLLKPFTLVVHVLVELEIVLFHYFTRGGGGGKSLTTWLATHPFPPPPKKKKKKKKHWKVCFQTSSMFFFKRGFFFFHFPLHLGVQAAKMLALFKMSFKGILFSATIKICHLGLCSASMMPFRGANVAWCDMPFRVHLIGLWMPGVAYLHANDPPPPLS